ncbi:MAG TPA: TetR/AcrR family transcriptional regulator, partial [Chthoniobacterales bacterium]|nr:TetR/AcrR family transcriptional regulator [Chthoniobacterales bacterium]
MTIKHGFFHGYRVVGPMIICCAGNDDLSFGVREQSRSRRIKKARARGVSLIRVADALIRARENEAEYAVWADRFGAFGRLEVCVWGKCRRKTRRWSDETGNAGVWVIEFSNFSMLSKFDTKVSFVDPANKTPDISRRLLDTALDLFSRRGYEGTGVQEIVATAGVTKPTLYHYFGSKIGVLNALLDRDGKQLLAQLQEAAA